MQKINKNILSLFVDFTRWRTIEDWYICTLQVALLCWLILFNNGDHSWDTGIREIIDYYSVTMIWICWNIDKHMLTDDFLDTIFSDIM